MLTAGSATAAANDLGCDGTRPAEVVDRPGDIAPILAATNAHRASLGLGPLTLDPVLQRAAQWKARDMARRGYFAHADPPEGDRPGRSVGERIASCARGAPGGGGWGENLARGGNAAGVVPRWLNSPGHRASIEGPGYGAIGIGVAAPAGAGGGSHFVQVFGSPFSVPGAFPPPPEPPQTTVIVPWTAGAPQPVGAVPVPLAGIDPWDAPSIEIVTADAGGLGRFGLVGDRFELTRLGRGAGEVAVTYRTVNLLGARSQTIGTVRFVLPPPPRIRALRAPRLAAPPRVGRTVRCVVRFVATDGTGVNLRYRWSAGGRGIARATGRTLRPAAALRGRMLRCHVLARSAGMNPLARVSAPRRVR